MLFGLEIFEIEPNSYTDLTKVEKENAALSKIWSIKQEWDNEWNGWKDTNFYELKLEEIDEKAVEVQAKLQSLEKDERKWKVTEFI
jgi:hypothetical protein